MKKTAAKGAKKAAKTKAKDGAAGGFTAEEREAMKARAKEQKAEARGKAGKADGERDVLAAIAAMPEHDRRLASRVHALVQENAPMLTPRTWYGMPAYAKDGDVVCFFQSAAKFKARYATLGFSDDANLDEGDMWPTAYALKELTGATEERIRALLRKAVG